MGKPWSPEQRKRLAFEKKLLSVYFPKFEWKSPARDTFLLGPMQTNSHKMAFDLKIVVPDTYPYTRPDVFILTPCPLIGYNGAQMKGPSANNHLLSPDADGHVQICHFHPERWTVNDTLVKVLLKARLWIEAFEGHASTGRPLDFFLKHQA